MVGKRSLHMTEATTVIEGTYPAGHCPRLPCGIISFIRMTKVYNINGNNDMILSEV